MSALEIWGLDDAAETVYRALLRNPDLGPAGLADHLHLDPDEVSQALEDLRGLGLVGPGSTGVQPFAPATTLASLLHDEVRDLEDRRARLDAVRASLSSFAADHMVGQTRGWSSVPFELLSPDEAFVAVEDLQRASTGEVVVSHPVVDIDVDSPTYVEIVEEQLRDGRRMRGLYPADVVTDPLRLDYVRRWARAGEDIRLMVHALPPMVAFGSEVALVSSTWGGGVEGHLLVRAPALVALVRELFEQYWARAVPLLPVEPGGDVDERRRILEMLMLGSKDEYIARHLQLSVRTVRRRIADIMEDLGARTRFQAGMEASRRGLL